MKYKRILLKLSGEGLMKNQGFGIDPERLNHYVNEIKKIQKLGVELAIVIGGGNIYRGKQAKNMGIDKIQGDYMGMMATIINGMALQSLLEKNNIYTRLMSSINIEQVCEPYIRRRAIRHLEKKRVIILGTGLGNPYFSTDSTASLRAIEIGAQVILKGTRVNGVYNKDPEKNKDVLHLACLTFQEAYQKKFAIMDLTAFTLCEENKLPIIVFNMNKPDNLLKVIQGENIGTLIS